MNRTISRATLGLLAALLVVVAIGAVGCGGNKGETSEAGSIDDSTNAVPDGSTAPQEARMSASALSFGRELLVSRADDIPVDQFESVVEALYQDGEGNWWAHVSATPPPSAMREAYQFFMVMGAGQTSWELVTEGTSVDPALFPEDVWQQIGYGSDAGEGTQATSDAAIAYAESLGGTSHEGKTLYLLIGASVDSESTAQAMLDEAQPRFGDMQSYFIVQRSDSFDGLEPGWWIVAEAYLATPSQENLDFGRRGFPNAYVKRVTVWTSDPIPVVEEILGQ